MSHFTPKEKEDIINRLRTLYSVSDKQLPPAHALRDDDSIIIHDENGLEKRMKLKDVYKNYAPLLWQKNIVYSVSCNVSSATVTIAVGDDEATECNTVSVKPGTKLTITVSADGYSTRIYNVVACYDYTLYVHLVEKAYAVFSIVDSDYNNIDDVRILWRKDNLGPWNELPIDYDSTESDSDDNSDSDSSSNESSATYTLIGNDEDIVYYKAIASGYEWSEPECITLDKDKPQDVTVILSGTEIKIYLSSNVNTSVSGGQEYLVIETLGEPLYVTVSSSESWVHVRYDSAYVKDKFYDVLTVTENTSGDERTATITVTNSKCSSIYETLTLTQNGE